MDYLGLSMHAIVLIIFFAATGIAVFAIVFNIDPNYILFSDLFPASANNWFIIAARFVAILSIAIEIARLCTLFLLFAVSLVYLYCSFLKKLEATSMNCNPIRKYTELQIINQIGMEPLRQMCAVLMGTGFLITVLGAWIFCLGWKYFPLLIYGLMCLVTLDTYTVIAVALPKVTKCHEFSQRLLKSVWPILLMKHFYLSGNTGFSFKVEKRKLQAQQPLNVYYGLARYDRATKTNFYMAVLEKTFTIILITKDINI